jgi:uncharacterized membrane protein YfcA
VELLLIATAGFVGGAMNALAGGGSFVTLPALVFAGLPPVMANATGTAALLPGYIMSAWRFRRDIRAPAGLSWPLLLGISLLGGSLGAALLTVGDPQWFARLAPWLILLATTLFALGPSLLASVRQVSRPLALGSVFVVCLYGGYFNGGLGIILLAALGLLGQRNLHSMNGVKNVLSAVLTAIAVLVYAAGGMVVWASFLPMALAAIVGGYAGAALAYRIPASWLRGGIVVVGLVMAAVFFLRLSA